MSSERERLRLHDIITNIDRIQTYIGGMSPADFAADPMRIDAVERCLQRITEAVIKIGPQRMVEIAPDLSVAAVRGLGNLLRHDYDRVSLQIIHATVSDRLPGLRDWCAKALEE